MSPHYLVRCVPQNVGGSQKSLLWVGIGGSEKNWFWCMATEMSGKQRHSKCSKWLASVQILASSLFHHWSTASSVTLCWNSAQDASTTRPYHRLVLDTCAVAACRRCSNLPGWGQGCWLATCQDWWTAVSHSTEAWLCHEHDVLAHCLAGRQTRLHQCCGSLVATSAAATRLENWT